MRLLQLAAVIVALCSSAYGYSCPTDGHTFYHADVSTGCQVYHLCVNGQMSTMTCPSGQAFDHHSSQCLDASTVHCMETDSHHRHKRSSVQAHEISIEVLKKNWKEFLETLRIALRKAVKDAAPTLLEVVDKEYSPKLESVKKDFEPIFYEKVLPRLEKQFEYLKGVAGKIIKKLQQSYEMSNSTHIKLVSFSDLASDLSKDMQPVLQLGRYLSSRLAPPKKRNA